MTDQYAILSTAFRDIVAVLSDVDAEEEWLPTGCAGWSVRDLPFHLRGDELSEHDRATLGPLADRRPLFG